MVGAYDDSEASAVDSRVMFVAVGGRLAAA